MKVDILILEKLNINERKKKCFSALIYNLIKKQNEFSFRKDFWHETFEWMFQSKLPSA